MSIGFQSDESNLSFNLAKDLVNSTSRHVFLTGKAGTGKTTFLKYIVEQTNKNAVVVAPTGVAAINAGGVTMHSFFQLPFNPFLPISFSDQSVSGQASDRQSLFKNIRFNKTRRTLFEELELLIIDEVSMVRCDMLDAVDAVLRHFRKKPKIAFGGVQVLYIGDMFQLPPVVSNPEWAMLKSHYTSPFFFGSKVVEEEPPLYVELKKIYRQNEQDFIDILNRIRHNETTQEDLDRLNQRYDPGFHADAGSEYITLTTHNNRADIKNDIELKKLSSKLFTYQAEVTGDFSDKSLPTEMILQLKEGAQVMFVKNDTGSDRKYYNGKLATIKKIFKDEIIVTFKNGQEDLKLEKETWKNIRYSYDRQTNKVDEEELGSFKQFPIRLAWAITIHKSQGLTFDKAIIDAGSSFAAGQVYVALSRCTSLDGLVLHSKIPGSAISTDPRIVEFAGRESNNEFLKLLLEDERDKFQSEALVKAFVWDKIVDAVGDWKTFAIEVKSELADDQELLTISRTAYAAARKQSEVAAKFQVQLKQLIATGNPDAIRDRVNSAIAYFSKSVVDELLDPLKQFLGLIPKGPKSKGYTLALHEIASIVIGHINRLAQIEYRKIEFNKPVLNFDLKPPPAPKKQKNVKGTSQRESLFHFLAGKSIPEVASMRALTESTVFSHLCSFIASGEVAIEALVESEKISCIMKVIEGGNISAGIIKSKLGDEYSFDDIRAVLEYKRSLKEKITIPA